MCYNIIKIKRADKLLKNREKELVMRTKLITLKEITREDLNLITILDIQSETVYDYAEEFFFFFENAKACFSMLAAHDYTAAEILGYSEGAQEKIRYRLMIDTLNRLIEDGFIICYTHAEALD